MGLTFSIMVVTLHQIHKLKKETQTTCYFAKPTKDKEGNIKRGIIPVILDTLLDQRKKTRAKCIF